MVLVSLIASLKENDLSIFSENDDDKAHAAVDLKRI